MRDLFRTCTVVFAVTFLAACGGEDEPTNGGDGGTGGSGGGSGGSGAAAPTGCNTDYAGIAAADTTPVDFTADVMPIFQGSCNFASCHSTDDNTPAAALQLGPPNMRMGMTGTVVPTAAEIQIVLDNIVDVASQTSPSTMRVASGDPGASFLIQKTSDTHNDQGHTDCTPQATMLTGCGQQMPNTGDALCLQNNGQDRFNTIVRWVAQLP